MCACVLSCFSHIRLCTTVWTVARQAPLSMGFSRQEYWSGLPCPPPGDLPNPGKEPRSLTLQVDSLLTEPPGNQLHFSACGDPVFQHHLLKKLSYFHWMSLAPMLKIIWLHMREFISGCSSIFQWLKRSILMPAQYYSNYYFEIILKPETVRPHLLFFSKIAFTI